MRILTILGIFLMLSACTSFVNIDYDKSTDFSSYKTYQIAPEPVSVSDDTRVNSHFMYQRVVNGINAVLINNGFKPSNEKAELEVKYFLDIKHDIETQNAGIVSIGIGSSSRHSALGVGFNIPVGETTNVDRLVLTIDMLARKTGKLIWRGSLGYLLYEGATPDTYTQLVNDLAKEILKNFPPK